jgi:hypothetical protein
MDLGRNPDWLSLHLLLLRPADKERCDLTHGTHENVQSPAARKKGDDVTVERERQCGLHRERERERERSR